ncbi:MULTISPECIES: primosomal replication protein PriC [unclassified Motilimonas]|uniref:primosomal replication protein PriC n=1 Tax=unclassified Motilimonas TaxID=2643697 RepID=UPI001E3FB8AB|nr:MULTISPECIES: primosomal replication protein PriC [unclassified Motilimonas]MCE0556369.1 primosomal replication protein [Motilimonas sp. E26]MDO6525861.1 primosomal replication protein PriC [Motilimonas sp. 1_MG-2023]
MVDISQLSARLAQLTQQCQTLDNQLTAQQRENFHFNKSLFAKPEKSLTGYCNQVGQRLKDLEQALTEGVSNQLIAHRCEALADQFAGLLKLVAQAQKGNGQLFSHHPAPEEKKLYQKLQKQYEYERRLEQMLAHSKQQGARLIGAEKRSAQQATKTLEERLERCKTATFAVELAIREFESSSAFIGNF